jgi:hypothetical protein
LSLFRAREVGGRVDEDVRSELKRKRCGGGGGGGGGVVVDQLE